MPKYKKVTWNFHVLKTSHLLSTDEHDCLSLTTRLNLKESNKVATGSSWSEVCGDDIKSSTLRMKSLIHQLITQNKVTVTTQIKNKKSNIWCKKLLLVSRVSRTRGDLYTEPWNKHPTSFRPPWRWSGCRMKPTACLPGDDRPLSLKHPKRRVFFLFESE